MVKELYLSETNINQIDFQGYALKQLKTMEDMFNFWIVYEPVENVDSEILSALLFKMSRGNS